MQLVEDLFVGFVQFEPTRQKSVNDFNLAGQNGLLNLVASICCQKGLADRTRVFLGCGFSCRAGSSLM